MAAAILLPALAAAAPTLVLIQALILILALAGPAGAQDRGAAGDRSLGSALQDCAAIKPLFDRLRCYDRLARDVDAFQTDLSAACGDAGGLPALEAAGAAPARSGTAGSAGSGSGGGLQVVRDAQVAGVHLTPNWKVDEVRDADGRPVEVRLSTAARTPLVEGSRPPTFNILCRERSTMMWLETGIAGSGDTTAVRLAHPGGGTQTLALGNTANGLAMGLWGGAEEALKPMLSQSAMTASFQPAGADTMVHVEFDLTGFDDAIEVIRLQCGW